MDNYLVSKFNMNMNNIVPTYFQYKIVPNYSRYFRFLFVKPFPFIITLDQKDRDNSMFVRGLERVQITPTN